MISPVAKVGCVPSCKVGSPTCPSVWVFASCTAPWKNMASNRIPTRVPPPGLRFALGAYE